MKSKKSGKAKKKKQKHHSGAARRVLIQLENVSKSYTAHSSFFNREKPVYALKNISFSLFEGESLGLVGESGSGKTTLARVLMCLAPYNEGRLTVCGKSLDKLDRAGLDAHYRTIQMVFQDSSWAMDPLMTALQIVEEPLTRYKQFSRTERRRKSSAMLRRVGLDYEHHHKYPLELSGGQRQRLGIARALVQNPRILILDEPTSALDVRVQAQILKLLRDLQATYRFSSIFISHDLAVIRSICDRVAVLRRGDLVEIGATDTVFTSATDPYTRELIASLPDIPFLRASA